MTAAHETTAQHLLNAAAEAQAEFWNALIALEDHLGVKIEGTRDLSEETVETLVEESITTKGDDDGYDE